MDAAIASAAPTGPLLAAGLRATFLADESLGVELKVYARREGTEIKLVVGEERPPGEGVRLVDSSLCDSEEEAAAVAKACESYLSEGKMPADDDGWHRFPADKSPNLLGAARKRVSAGIDGEDDVGAPDEIEAGPAAAKATSSRVRLTHRRAAWFGYLVGQGYTAKRIAADEIIRSTVNNVYRIANRLGLSLTAAPRGQVDLQLPLATMAVYERIAAQAHLQPEAFIQKMLIRAAKDPARFILPLVSS